MNQRGKKAIRHRRPSARGGERPAVVATRIPPGAYNVACVGHEGVVTGKCGIKGVALLFKVIRPLNRRDPASGKIVKTGGAVIRHTFWMTGKSLAFHMRDARVILGHSLRRLDKFAKAAFWVGKTCKVVIRDETFRGVTYSRVHLFDRWQPTN
jgi:hypothetical protein